MKIAGLLLTGLMLLGVACEAAEATEFYYTRRYRPTAEELEKQHRITMQERTYQLRVRQENARVAKERARLTSPTSSRRQRVHRTDSAA